MMMFEMLDKLDNDYFLGEKEMYVVEMENIVFSLPDQNISLFLTLSFSLSLSLSVWISLFFSHLSLHTLISPSPCVF